MGLSPQGQPNVCLRFVSLPEKVSLGNHCHLLELHFARDIRSRNGVEKVNSRWARGRAPAGPEVQGPPRGSPGSGSAGNVVLGHVHTLS